MDRPIPISVTPDLFRGPPGGSLPDMKERRPCACLLAGGFDGTPYVGVRSDPPGRMMRQGAGTSDGLTRERRVTRPMRFEVADTMDAAIASQKRAGKRPRDWKNPIGRGDSDGNDRAVAPGLDRRGFGPLAGRMGKPRNGSGVTKKEGS